MPLSPYPVEELVEDPLDPSIDPLFMRSVMGSFCSGVVLVTAFGDEPLGFTCQSFVSLSLEPPLISISPAKSSSTWPRIREVGRFAVNVLADDHDEVSRAFARSGTDKYAGVEWAPAPLGSPLLAGASAWMECVLWNEYEAGDHTIAIGRVHSLGHDTERLPLLFHRGHYGRLSGSAG